MAQTNLDKLNQLIKNEHKPFIVYDVETTGVMNGNDNHITQIALCSYKYNAKEKQYEMQDNIFMLAKGDNDVLKEIEENELVSPENIDRKLKEEYIYKLTQKNKGQKELIKANKETYINTPECKAYVENKANRVSMQKEMEDTPSLKTVLSLQGIDLNTYRKEKDGLTYDEIQIGLTSFLNRYKTNDTVFVNNGTYYAKHYMDKDGIFLGNNADNTIDLVQAERSRHGGVSAWTSDIKTFSENYKKDTGKEIEVFDALTKSLCLGEITTKATELNISHNSENYLQSKVKEIALSKDEDYVLSATRASYMRWIPANQRDFEYADYRFDSLEYIDFGNDRRYVDIDKMFEINDDFKITLEGEKTPIKTWEELETKIKSLNGLISDKLLEKIHDKYEEMLKEAKEMKKEKEPDAVPVTEPVKETEPNKTVKDGEKVVVDPTLSALSVIERKQKEIDEMCRNFDEKYEDFKKVRETLKEQEKTMLKNFNIALLGAVSVIEKLNDTMLKKYGKDYAEYLSFCNADSYVIDEIKHKNQTYRITYEGYTRSSGSMFKNGMQDNLGEQIMNNKVSLEKVFKIVCLGDSSKSFNITDLGEIISQYPNIQNKFDFVTFQALKNLCKENGKDNLTEKWLTDFEKKLEKFFEMQLNEKVKLENCLEELDDKDIELDER